MLRLNRAPIYRRMCADGSAGLVMGFTGLAFALTIGRLYVRARIIKSVYWDDAAHLLGLTLLLAQVSIVSSSTSIMHQLGAYKAGAITRKQVSLSFSLDLAGILVS